MALRNAYDELPEPALVAAVLAREPAAWPSFFARYERLVGACIRRVLRRYHAEWNEEDVEDIVSTTALHLVKDDYKKLRTFDPTRGYKLSSWVGLIATNAAHDALRRRGPADVNQAASLDDEQRPLDLASTTEDPERHAVRRDAQAHLHRAFNTLGPSDRAFVEYYFIQELDPEDIARLMGIAVNTVYSRKNKVREKLRRALGGVEGVEAP